MGGNGRQAPKRDFAETAFAVFQHAIGEKPAAQLELPEPAKVTRARKGGLEGGKARADSLTPERRSEIARVAAAARWKKGA